MSNDKRSRSPQQAANDYQRRANDAKFAERLSAEGENPYRSQDHVTYVDLATEGGFDEDRGPPLKNSRLFGAQFAAALGPLTAELEAFEREHNPENIAAITIRPSQAQDSQTGPLLDPLGNAPLENLRACQLGANDEHQRAMEELQRRNLVVPLVVGRHADPINHGASFDVHNHYTVICKQENARAVGIFLREIFGSRVWISNEKKPEEKRSLVRTSLYPAWKLANRGYAEIGSQFLAEFYRQSHGLRRIEMLGPLRSFRQQQRNKTQEDVGASPTTEPKHSQEAVAGTADLAPSSEAGTGRTQSTASSLRKQNSGAAAEQHETSDEDAAKVYPDQPRLLAIRDAYLGLTLCRVALVANYAGWHDLASRYDMTQHVASAKAHAARGRHYLFLNPATPETVFSKGDVKAKPAAGQDGADVKAKPAAGKARPAADCEAPAAKPKLAGQDAGGSNETPAADNYTTTPEILANGTANLKRISHYEEFTIELTVVAKVSVPIGALLHPDNPRNEHAEKVGIQ